MVADNRIKQEERVEALKLALVTHDPAHWTTKLFPEITKRPEPERQGETVQTDEELFNTEGEWQFTDTPTAEEAQKILASIMANPTGTLTAEDLDDDEGGWS